MSELEDITPEDSVASVFLDLTPADPIEIAPLTAEQIASKRKLAFEDESDPIFFKWKRGEASEQDWLDAVEMVRTRYPKPDDHS